MRKGIFFIYLTASFLQSAMASANTGACYILTKLGNNPWEQKCYEGYSEQQCIAEHDRTNWELQQAIRNRNTSFRLGHKWFEGIPCR